MSVKKRSQLAVANHQILQHAECGVYREQKNWVTQAWDDKFIIVQG